MNAILNIIKNKKIRKWAMIAIIATLAILAIFGFVFPPTGRSNAQTEGTSTVVSLNVAETIEASGDLDAQPFAALEWKTSGIVEEVNVKPGDLVKQGDILLSLQPSSTSYNAVIAKSDLVLAQQDLEDLLKSDTSRAQAAIDLDNAQEEYDEARDWRISLNDQTWVNRRTYRYIQGRQVAIDHWSRDYADSETIAEADRDLALEMSQLEDAQREYDRLQDGPDPDDITAAQAKVDAAQATVNTMYIIAPFDGQILSVGNEARDTVSVGELSVNMADLNSLYVETQVDETDIANIRLGNPAEITLDALPDVTLTGRVSVINPVGEVVSGLVKYNIRVDLDEVKDTAFVPLGTTANVTIMYKEEAKLLAVPITAIQNDENGEYVWVVRNGAPERVDVVGGTIIGELVTVTGALREGEILQIVEKTGFAMPNPLSGGK